MHLSNIFGVGTFPVFWPFRTFFDGQKFCKNIPKILPKHRNWSESIKNVKNMTKISKIDPFFTVIFKIFDICRKFRSIKWPKFDQNFQLSSKNSPFLSVESWFSEILLTVERIFGFSFDRRKRLEILSFFILRKAKVKFRENPPDFKNLTRTHGRKYKKTPNCSGEWNTKS